MSARSSCDRTCASTLTGYVVPRTGRLTTHERTAGGVGSPTVQTATQQAAWRARIVEADKVCFGALMRAAAVKAKVHSPATVIPIIFSAGGFSARGALRACDNDLLPEPEDRNGRHWLRVELGTILMKFAFEFSVQLWSRRDSSGVPLL